MNEKFHFRDVLIKAVIVLICAGLYSLGGAEFGPGKWVRRFLFPSILCGGMYWFSRDWRSLVSFPLLVIGTSLGYGAEETITKVIKRTYCGVILGAGASVSDLLNKRFIIAAFQTLMITSGMVVLGVFSVLPNARTEEFVIGLLIGLPLFSARKRL